MKISICMIVKDEEKYLPGCLRSIKPLIDAGIAELIIVDTGSKDRTVEIAKEFTDEIYFHPWQGSFSEARNFSISLAKGEFIMTLDADEELESAGVERLINLFNSNECYVYNTFVVKAKNFQDSDLKSFSLQLRELIFRNDGEFYYEGSIHNQPKSKEPYKHLEIGLLHYGYIMTDEIKEKKFVRTSELLIKELDKDPENTYYRARLAAAYSMHGDFEEALKQIEFYVERIIEKNEVNKENIQYLNDACVVYMNNNMYEKVLTISERCQLIEPEFIDFIYYRAYSLYKLKIYSEAAVFCKMFLNNVDDFYKQPLINDTRYMFYTLDSKDKIFIVMIESLYELSRFSEIIYEIANYSNYINVLSKLSYPFVNSCLHERRYDDFTDIYFKSYGEKDNVLCHVMGYAAYEWVSMQEYCIKKEFFRQLDKYEKTRELYDYLLKMDSFNDKQKIKEFIWFISLNDLNDLDSITVCFLADRFLNSEKIIYSWNNYNDDEILTIKEFIVFILKHIPKERVRYVLEKYIELCRYIIKNKKINMLSLKESIFINNFNSSQIELEKGNIINALKYIKDGIAQFSEMAKPIQIYLEKIIPKEGVERQKLSSSEEFNRNCLTIKKQIEYLITNGDLDEVQKILNEYKKIIRDDLDIYSMEAIVYMESNRFEEAEKVLQKALQIDNNNFDILYNLGYLYEKVGNKIRALGYYSKAKENCTSYEMRKKMEIELERIKGI